MPLDIVHRLAVPVMLNGAAIFKQRPQALPRPLHARLHCRDRQPEVGCNIDLPLAEHVHALQHDSIIARQHCQHRLHASAQFRRCRRIIRRIRFSDVGVGKQRRRSAGGAARSINDRSPRHREQPGIQRLLINRIAVLNEPGEHILHNVVCIVCRTHPPPDERPKTSEKLIGQCAVRGVVHHAAHPHGWRAAPLPQHASFSLGSQQVVRSQHSPSLL